MAKVLLVPNGYRLLPKLVRSIITCKTNDVEPIHTLGSSLIFRYYIFSIVSTIYCVCYFLFALYFVFLFCIFHHFHEFFKKFADKMTTCMVSQLYFAFTSQNFAKNCLVRNYFINWSDLFEWSNLSKPINL